MGVPYDDNAGGKQITSKSTKGATSLTKDTNTSNPKSSTTYKVVSSASPSGVVGISSSGGGGSSRSSSSSTKSSSNSYYNQVAQYEQQMKDKMAEMEELNKKEEAALRKAIQSGVTKLEGGRTDINQSYDDMERQLYIDRRRNERLIPQQLAAQGYTGGLSESSNLNLQSSYQDALARGGRARTQELANLDREIANFQASGDAQIAQLATQFAQNALSIYMQLQSQMLNEKRWQTEMARYQ